MLGAPDLHHIYLPRYFAESSSDGSENSLHQRERLLADLRQRQAAMFGGHHSGFGGMGAYPPHFLGGQGMMGGYPGRDMGMGMGLPIRGGLGGMGMHPAMGMGMGPAVGVGGRIPFSPSPYGHSRPVPFGYQSRGPPRAHSFRSPYSHSQRSPFSRMCDFTEDDFDDEYRLLPRHSLGRRNRRAFKLVSQHPRGRRGYRPGPYYDDSDDDFDEYDDYDDDWDGDDEYDNYYGSSRRPQAVRWM
ncbi:hypothetical protein FB567DRAFT_77978 [Paraphoma chrysanthemicola]|uniref:Uncharacterized protein n=1 Tax=Paraphoma chrysanthemicola TaxID=798071 RepID=A0A8K0R2I6_9PLEO|nr:hypothetical protein FB567DRAFT_77978 [Paraphoma chrysanthemicola]